MPENIRMISASVSVEHPPSGPEAEQFKSELEIALDKTERALREISDDASSWQRARSIVEQFRPVPWFIWRLSNFVFSGSGQKIPEGMVLGLRRLLFAAASDTTLCTGARINRVGQALELLPPDIIAAVSVIHAINRKLSVRALDRVWRPYLEDALIRAKIGALIGRREPSFGVGKGILAGYGTQCGLAILVATGTEEQGTEYIELVAKGEPSRASAKKIYGCDPVHIAAITLSATGCGQDASFGMMNYLSDRGERSFGTPDQACWVATAKICEAVRGRHTDALSTECWDLLGFENQSARDTLIESATQICRRGHGWSWIL